MSLKKVGLLVFAVSLVFTACSDDDTGTAGATVELPAGIWTNITNGNAFIGKMVASSADWRLVKDDPFMGLGAVCDPLGSDTMYIVVVPGLLGSQTHVMTNAAYYMANKATWVQGYPFEQLNSGPTTLAPAWVKDYTGYIGGPAGNCAADPADIKGELYGQKVVLMKEVANGQLDGTNVVFAAAISKRALAGQAGVWGVDATDVALKIAFKSVADNADFDGNTDGFVATPDQSPGFTLTGIPDWVPSAALAVSSTLPASGDVVASNATFAITFSEAPTNVTDGALSANIVFIVSNTNTGGTLASDGSNIGVTVSGPVVTVTNGDLFTADNGYEIILDGFVADNGKTMPPGGATIRDITCRTLTSVTVGIHTNAVTWNPTHIHVWDAPGAFSGGGTAWQGQALEAAGADGWITYTMDVYLPAGSRFNFIIHENGSSTDRIQTNAGASTYYTNGAWQASK